MKNPPAFQFYAADFLIGVMGMSDEEVGIYMRMLCTQWVHGFLPNCQKSIKKLINCGKKPSEKVMKKFAICDDGLLRNERLESVREKQKKFAESRQNNANTRWKKDASALQVHSQKPCINDALQSSSSSSSSSIKFNKPSLDELNEYIKSINAGINAQTFIDYYDSVNWQIGKNQMKCWKAAVRTWKNRNNKPNGPRPIDEKLTYQKNGNKFRPFD